MSDEATANTGAVEEPASLPDLALRSIGSAVAIADPETWQILFENGRFFEWFSPEADPDAPLGARIPELDLTAAADKLARGRPYASETELTSGARTISAEVVVRRLRYGDREVALVEAHDIAPFAAVPMVLHREGRSVHGRGTPFEPDLDHFHGFLLGWADGSCTRTSS